MTDRFNRAIEPLWVFLHRGHVIRRVVLFVAVWMTLDAYEWAKAYGVNPDANQWIVTAVMAVPSTLLAAAIKFYNSGRSAEPWTKGEQ